MRERSFDDYFGNYWLRAGLSGAMAEMAEDLGEKCRAGRARPVCPTCNAYARYSIWHSMYFCTAHRVPLRDVYLARTALPYVPDAHA